MKIKNQEGTLDYRLQEVIRLMRTIQDEVAKTPDAVITEEEAEKGMESSALGAKQEPYVNMTPLMKNALVRYGDTKEGSAWRLKAGDPETKAEKAIVSNMKLLLLKFNGSSETYDENLPLMDKRHYDVQCHQNFKENMRDIVPGQADERRKMMHEFTKETSNTVDVVISMIEESPEFQKAILVVLNQLPEVKASDNITEINLPFMTKHTGVGYPFWHNDRAVTKDGNKSYAKVTMEIAEQYKNKPSEWYKFNVSTAYGRNQRGKGRLLIAVSRILNLLLNQLEGVEIPTYKEKSPLFVGYRDDVELKGALQTMVQECEEHGLKCANEDYSRFDSTVGTGILVLTGALSIMKANGAKSKQIALMRAVFSTKTILVDGLDRELLNLLGRVFSGFIDTNRGGGICNAMQMTTCCMIQDRRYTNDIVYPMTRYMMVMGDDNLHAYRKLNRKKLADDMKRLFGGNINEDKYEFGPIFLQYRLFSDPKTMQPVMVYAWTRVVRSMLMKEEAKHLGPVGWTYAFYQQLFKLIEFKEALYIAVNLLIVFDKNLFYKDVPIKQLNEMLKQEDAEALAKAKTDAQKRRVSSTADMLFDGDPSKDRFAQAMANPEDPNSVLNQIQEAIREVYDPHFYDKNGLFIK